MPRLTARAALLGALGVACAATPCPAAPAPPAEGLPARQVVVIHLVGQDALYRLRATGARYKPYAAVEAEQSLRYFLAGPAATLDAWLDLAIGDASKDDRTDTGLAIARRWAQAVFAFGEGQASGRLAEEFRAAMRKRQRALLDAARREFRANGGLPYGRLLAELEVWEAVPLLLDASRASAAQGRVGPEAALLVRLTLRDPRGQQALEWSKLTGAEARAWDRDWQSWWAANRNAPPARAVLAAARKGQLPAGADSALRLARRLIGGARDLPTRDLLDLLDSDWPRFAGVGEKPKEDRIATEWTYARDAAFLIAYGRQPRPALAALKAGLGRADRVRGQRLLGEEPHSELYKPAVFRALLSAGLKADLDARVRDRNGPAEARVKWLVLRDQFFPPGKDGWKYLSLVRGAGAHAGTWEVERAREGERTWRRYTPAQLEAMLKERGF